MVVTAVEFHLNWNNIILVEKILILQCLYFILLAEDNYHSPAYMYMYNMYSPDLLFTKDEKHLDPSFLLWQKWKINKDIHAITKC